MGSLVQQAERIRIRRRHRTAQGNNAPSGYHEKETERMATITCTRCGRTAERMDGPPTGGQLGITIQDRICRPCWNEWVGEQALIINHYGLEMGEPDRRKQLLQVMKEFLGLEKA